MSHGLLEILRYFLLALLWLFFIYAARMVIVDVRRSRAESASSGPESAEPTSARATSLRLRVVAPPARRGRTYPLGAEVTLGRSSACVVLLDDDDFASSVHARVFSYEGVTYVEDLGSTNGTYVNEERIASPTPLERGDLLRVGSTVLEVRR